MTSAAADAELADAAGYLLRDLAWERPMLVSVLGGKDVFWQLSYCIELCFFQVPLIFFFVPSFHLLFLGCCSFASRVTVVYFSRFYILF